MAEYDMFPSNSNKMKDYKKPERQHATAIAKRAENNVPDSFMRKIIKLFLAEDVTDPWGFLVRDLIIPGIKDVGFDFISYLFWGNTKPSGGSNKIPYNKPSQISRIRNIGSQRKEDPEEAQALKKLDLNNIAFASQAEAKEVLLSMKSYIDSYQSIPMAVLLELIDEKKSIDWTSEYYGWTDLSDARIRPTSRGGWLLILPRPERL